MALAKLTVVLLGFHLLSYANGIEEQHDLVITECEKLDRNVREELPECRDQEDQADRNDQGLNTRACFPGSASVRLADGREITVDQLRPGYVVLSVDSQRNLVYSKYLYMLHYDADQETDYVNIWPERQLRPLTLTPGHLVFVRDQNDDIWRAVHAGNVTPGQMVGVLQREADVITPRQVSRVTRHKELSLYSPLTEHGTIVVNDVMVSCYTKTSNHEEANAVFGPIRALYSLGPWNALLNKQTLATGENMHWFPSLTQRVFCGLGLSDVC